jgi:hypothetical protein
MAFTPKTWKDRLAGGTDISAASLIDLENRVYAGAVADAISAVGAVGGGGAVFSTTMPTTAGVLWVKKDGSGNIIGLSAVVNV